MCCINVHRKTVCAALMCTGRSCVLCGLHGTVFVFLSLSDVELTIVTLICDTKPYSTGSNEKSFPLSPFHCPSYSWFFFQGTLGSLQNLPGVLSAYRTWAYMCILFRSVSEWAGEMVQWIKSPAAMPTNLSLTQATHTVEGETDSQKLSSDPNIKTYTLTNIMTYFF